MRYHGIRLQEFARYSFVDGNVFIYITNHSCLDMVLKSWEADCDMSQRTIYPYIYIIYNLWFSPYFHILITSPPFFICADL